jgi:hypothetical protein
MGGIKPIKMLIRIQQVLQPMGLYACGNELLEWQVWH